MVDLSNNFGLQEYGIAFRKGSDMVEAVNAAIAELTEDGTVAEIAERYGLTDSHQVSNPAIHHILHAFTAGCRGGGRVKAPSPQQYVICEVPYV